MTSRPEGLLRHRLGMKVLASTAILALSLATCSPAAATPSLIGDVFQIRYSETPFPDLIDSVTVGGAPEIVAGDSSNIGSTLLLDGEFLDIGATSIVYRVFGGGPPYPGPPSGYLTTGVGPDAQFEFSDLSFPAGEAIIGVGIVLSNVVGVSLGSEVSFTDSSVILKIGTLGVLETPENLGTITLNLELTGPGNSGPPGGTVPGPPTLVLIAGGLIGAALIRRRRDG